MAAIKAYTDLEQSKKLAEILPLESADMYWWSSGKRCYIEAMDDGDFNEEEGHVRAWSLAALLNVLPPYLYEWEKGIDFSLYPSVAKKRWWCAGYISQDLSPENKDKFTFITHADNPIDACVAMVEKLHELNLI